jgi:peptidyl-prolyl cis-trans isomerase D
VNESSPFLCGCFELLNSFWWVFMFDFVHENKRIVQIILALIILPFAFWGVNSARNAGADASLAKVNGEKISPQEFDNARQQQAQRMREAMGGQFDSTMLERTEFKNAILENLVTEHVLSSEAKRHGLSVGDEQLAQIIAGVEAFQVAGKFDKKRYQEALSAQNMTPEAFEYKVRQDISGRQLTAAYVNSGYAASAVVDQLIRLNEQQRVVSVAQLDFDSVLKKVQVSAADVKAYYEKNASEFQLPEQVKVDYVTLSAATLENQTVISEAAIKQYYDEHVAEFATPELRQAAHILIAVAKQASDADKETAKKKAEQILQQVKQAPAKFAELAAKNSQDPGSAAKGGDLGEFGRGMMVKAFEDAAFSLKVGEISGLVQSDFGFHIIKLNAIKAGAAQPLAAVKATIAQRLKAQTASDRFAELAEKFNNTVYEQSDSLKPAATLIGGTIQKSAWLLKGQAPAGIWDAKLLAAVFSDDALNKSRNTSAIDVGQNVLVAAHVVEHQPARARPLAEVSASINGKLQHQQALDLAEKEGSALLAKLQKGESVNLTWQAEKTVSRNQRDNLNVETLREIFKADAKKLPAFIAQKSIAGYVIVRVNAVKDIATIGEAKRTGYAQQLQRIMGEELLRAYSAEAKKNADISVKLFAETEKK